MRAKLRPGKETKVLDGLSYPTNFVLSGNGIYYVGMGPGMRDSAIRYFDVATRRSTVLWNTGKQWWYGIALSPDERYLVYSVVDSGGSNLMVVNGVR